MRSFALLFLLFTACAHTPVPTLPSAPNFTHTRLFSAPFTLTISHKITNPAAPTHIYLEGDGRAWLNRTTPSLNPTPKNPTALYLAQKDPAPNVIYIARPCQYTPITKNTPCPRKYWTSHIFAPEVITSINDVISQLKQKHNLNNLHLFGFSGGANLAALIAAQRVDVKNLTTIAGNLNPTLFQKHHKLTPTPHSLNALSVAPHIQHLKQTHFIGAQDKIIPPLIATSFKEQTPQSPSMTLTVVPNTSHHKNWPQQWPALLRSIK